MRLGNIQGMNGRPTRLMSTSRQRTTQSAKQAEANQHACSAAKPFPRTRFPCKGTSRKNPPFISLSTGAIYIHTRPSNQVLTLYLNLHHPYLCARSLLRSSQQHGQTHLPDQQRVRYSGRYHGFRQLNRQSSRLVSVDSTFSAMPPIGPLATVPKLQPYPGKLPRLTSIK